MRELAYEAMTIITEEATVLKINSSPFLNIIGDLHG